MSFTLPSYNNQKEKKEFFSVQIIDTDWQLYDFMSSLPSLFNNKQGIWRGLPESKYKLYNSLQRKNLELKKLNSTEDVIKAIVESTNLLENWNKGLIKNYFSNYGIKKIPIYAKLSILQHYGCETPLLDWTRNPNVALYFATLSQTKLQIKNSIDDYFSIYFINKEHPYFNFTSKTGYEYFTSNNPKIILNRFLKFKKIRFSNSFINEYINDDRELLNSICRFPIQKIDDDEIEYINHYTKSNYNILAQKGLFILNADPYLPLEESIIQRIKNLSKSKPKIDIDDALVRNKQNFVCYDIHKKFISKIAKALISQSVNIIEDTMFPNLRKLKDEISFKIYNQNN